jgi:predicted helicase
MTEERHQKGLDFEKRVANYYRRQGYEDVRIREHHTGEITDVKHELDVVVYEFSNPIIGCQCKYKETGSVTKNDIAKWRDKCEDVGVEPHYASTEFSTNAKKYAKGRGVEIISTEELEGITVESLTVEGWVNQLEDIETPTQELLFCLRTVYETGILEDAARASYKPATLQES